LKQSYNQRSKTGRWGGLGMSYSY